MIKNLTIVGGFDKLGNKESIQSITLEKGCIYTIVGKTGSGKTLLMEDIESLNYGEGITKRTILIDHAKPDDSFYYGNRSRFIAHLSQNMNFILDMPVIDFLTLRNQIQFSDSLKASPNDVLSTANVLTGEEIEPNQLLTKLSGGQSRALMIADVALNNAAPVILIDEVENAGIDRIKAMSLLTKHKKIVLVVTHDPLLALYGIKRIVLKNGGISQVINRTEEEKLVLEQLINVNNKMDALRLKIRNGESLEGVDNFAI